MGSVDSGTDSGTDLMSADSGNRLDASLDCQLRQRVGGKRDNQGHLVGGRKMAGLGKTWLERNEKWLETGAGGNRGNR